MNNFYIYLHITFDTRVPFYIGKGNGNRAWVKSHRSKHWQHIVSKHGYDVKLLHTDLNEAEANELEIHYIKQFGRRDLGTGVLANFTDGGEGSTGRIVSDKVRLAVAEANRKRDASAINRQKTGSLFKGKFGSEHNRSKAVLCNGITYGSMSEAARKLNIDTSSVSWAIKHNKTIFGMHFEAAG